MTDCVYVLKLNEDNTKDISKKAYDFVRKIYFDEFGIKNAQFTFSPKGKPYIKDCPDFHFNISHSKNLMAVAFSKKPVGIDIEKLTDANLKIAQRYFTEEEKNYVKDGASFFYVWTRKEAFVKQKGDSICNALSSICVLNKKNIKTYSNTEFVLSVCSDNADDFVIIV